jgi:hypothetical protein
MTNAKKIFEFWIFREKANVTSSKNAPKDILLLDIACVNF